MTTSPTTAITVAAAAEILKAVIDAQYPKIALPTIASNRDMTMAELQALLQRHGYPDKAKMRKAWAALLTEGDKLQPDADSPPVDDVVPTPEARKDPYVTALPVSDLFADPAYQRDLDENRVARMVKDYDPALVGIIEVSERPQAGGTNRYAIVDGQHRWAAVRDKAFDTTDRPHIVCRVHSGLTVDEEAKLYHRLNTTRKQLTGWDRWRARRSSGDTAVVDIEATVTEAGWTVSYLGKRGQIKSTSGLEKVHTLGGRQLLVEVLDVITSAWRDDPEGVTNNILQGLAHILANYTRDELDLGRLVEALSGIVPRQLNARAAAARELHKGTLDKLTAYVVIGEYNQLRRDGQVEAFFSRVKPLSPNKGTARAADVERAAAIKRWALLEGLIHTEKAYITVAIRQAYDAAHPESEDS